MEQELEETINAHTEELQQYQTENQALKEKLNSLQEGNEKVLEKITQEYQARQKKDEFNEKVIAMVREGMGRQIDIL